MQGQSIVKKCGGFSCSCYVPIEVLGEGVRALYKCCSS